MISYTKKNVVTITLVLTIFVYSVISVIISKNFFTHNNTKVETVQETNKVQEISVEDNIQNTGLTSVIDNNVWSIEIPKINLFANIEEGTDLNVIAKNVGHFSITNTIDGNIGLAAHNRGFGDKSYFKDIKYLNYGDEIIYKKDEKIKRYKVIKNLIIDETDWSYLQNTDDNRITLITCVEDIPECRRCVQGIEI